MLITAVMSLIFNLIQMRILHQDDGHYHFHDDQENTSTKGSDVHEHGHSHGHGEKNVNVEAAFLHALGDMIMSIGVIIASVIIYIWPKLTYADSICTFIFSVIVCITTFPLISQCINVMMEAAPKEIDSMKLIEDIR